MAAAIKAATGVRPRVEDGGKYAILRFTPGGQVAARSWLESQLAKKPGDVRVEVSPVLNPFIAKKALPYLLGAAAAGLLLGKVLE
jgi:hypothetical protein